MLSGFWIAARLGSRLKKNADALLPGHHLTQLRLDKKIEATADSVIFLRYAAMLSQLLFPYPLTFDRQFNPNNDEDTRSASFFIIQHDPPYPATVRPARGIDRV